MSDLIIEGAKGIPDGLYVIEDGLLFKYKPNGGTVYTVRSYHIMDRPKGEWLESREQNILMAKRIEKGETWRVCSNCGTGFMIGAQYEGQKLYGERFHNFCPRCGADMRSE